jgi:hypothetical protein
MSVSQLVASLMKFAKLRNNLAGHTGICQQVGFIRALFGKHDCTTLGAGRWGMSDAIQQAIEAMDMARSAVGPFGVVVTKKLTNAIEALQALQSGEPVVDEAVFDILKAAQGSCRLGFNDIADKQIEIAIKALLSAGKETV